MLPAGQLLVATILEVYGSAPFLKTTDFHQDASSVCKVLREMAEDYSGSDPPESSYHHQDTEPSVYGRHSTTLGGPLQYEQHQYEGGYGYQLQYPVTTGGSLYVDQQGPYSRGATSLDYQHYPPSPQNHLIPSQQQPRNYECATLHHSIDHHAGVDALQQQNHPVPSPAAACLEMNYGGPQQHHNRGVQPQRPNPRQQQAHGQLQAQSTPSVYPAPSSHYGSPVHAHLGVHAFPGSQQQWSDYSTTQSRMISSPNSPSPAHTPTPPIASSGLSHSSSPTSQPVHSPPLLAPHSRTPTPTSAIPSPTPTMSGQYPAHQHHSLGPGGPSQSHSLSWGHSNVANQPQAIGLHQSGRQPSNSISPQPHNFYAPPMSSSARGPTQPLSCVTGSSPPPTVHSPPTTSVRSTPPWGSTHGGGSGGSEGTLMAASKVHSGGGPGNPLASLQLLVDQDMNRSGGGGGGGVPSGSPYRGAVPPNAHSASPSSIDLSAAKASSELNISTPPPPPIHSPRSHLSYVDASSEGVRNGNTHGASSPAPPRPPVVNGEASSGGDSGIGSPSVGGGAPTPTPPPEGGPHISVRPGPVRDGTVRVKLGTPGPDVEYLHNISSQAEVEPLPLVASGRRQASDSAMFQEVADLSRSGFAGQPRNVEASQLIGEGLAVQMSGGNIARAKGLALKRTKKVDAILENLVESGSKKLATGGNERSSPVSLVTTQPSVVVSEAPSATPVIAPTVVVSAPPAPAPVPSPIPAAPGEESTSAPASTPEGPSPTVSHPDSPPSQSPENSPRKNTQSVPKSPSRGSGSGDMEDEAVSPTFDDAQGGDKPRRKRKPDNPLRLKAPDAEGSAPVSGKTTPPSNVSSKETSSLEETDKANTQESAKIKDPKCEIAKDKIESSPSEVISEKPKQVSDNIKMEVDNPNPTLASKDSGIPSTSDKLSSPKTSSFVEPKREKTTPKTKAEQKYVYRQYEVGDVAPPPKKLDFGQGDATVSENVSSPDNSCTILSPATPSVNAQGDSAKENEQPLLKEEMHTGCVTSNSVSSVAPSKLNPSVKPAAVKVEEIVFGLEGNALESVVKKIDTTAGVVKVESGIKSSGSQIKELTSLKSQSESLPSHAPTKVASPVKTEVKNTFSEVEDQLAMMFAGIIEPEDGQPPKTAQLTESVEPKDSLLEESVDSKTAVKVLQTPSATQEVQEALSTPPSTGRKAARGRPKTVTVASAGETSCGSVDGSPRKRKRKRLADDEEEYESSTPRRTKKVKGQGSASDRSPAAVTPGSEGEGSGVGTSTTEATPNSGVKKKKKKKKVASDSKYAADFPREFPKKRVIVAEEKQPRGPYIRVEGPRDGPRRVTVVNVGSRGGGTLGEDEEGGDKGALRARGRRKLGVGGAKVAKDGSRGGAKAAVQAGSDSSQPDRSWVCVFCRRGSHSDGLGDLFGPYVIGKDAPEDEDDVERNGHLDTDAIGEGAVGKTGKGRRSSGVTDAVGNKAGKKQSRRRWSVTTTTSSFPLGPLEGAATPASPNGRSGDGPGSGRLEVWVHEECALWAAGLYQIGSRIVGLNEAVWSSAKTMCGQCGVAGANIGCVRRGCGQHLHYPCARDHGWQLDEEEFLASCPPHMKGVKSSVSVLPT